MVVKAINNKAEWDALLAEGKPVLVDFYATWCGPCKVISPMFEQHSENPAYKDVVTFAKIDVDAVPDVAAELGIRAMPTFLLFKDGKKVDEMLGANPQGLQGLVQKAV
ncbi:hypothetical protein VUR80DRAFT_3813 [Thermomyces stellatus]